MLKKNRLAEDVTIEEIWIEPADFDRQCEYLLGAYLCLEDDFLEYLEYAPYREEHLHVSSSRLADFILRITPLLSISFRALTFGGKMKGAYEYWLHDPSHGRGEVFDKYTKELKQLYVKKEKHIDSLNEYYELHVSNVFTLWDNDNLIKREIMLNYEVSRIEFSKALCPFQKEKWFSWKDLRNEIEHRGRTEATLEDVLYGLAFLIILLEQLYSWKDAFFEYSSNLFQMD